MRRIYIMEATMCRHIYHQTQYFYYSPYQLSNSSLELVASRLSAGDKSWDLLRGCWFATSSDTDTSDRDWRSKFGLSPSSLACSSSRIDVIVVPLCQRYGENMILLLAYR